MIAAHNPRRSNRRPSNGPLNKECWIRAHFWKIIRSSHNLNHIHHLCHTLEKRSRICFSTLPNNEPGWCLMAVVTVGIKFKKKASLKLYSAIQDVPPRLSHWIPPRFLHWRTHHISEMWVLVVNETKMPPTTSGETAGVSRIWTSPLLSSLASRTRSGVWLDRTLYL